MIRRPHNFSFLASSRKSQKIRPGVRLRGKFKKNYRYFLKISVSVLNFITISTLQTFCLSPPQKKSCFAIYEISHELNVIIRWNQIIVLPTAEPPGYKFEIAKSKHGYVPDPGWSRNTPRFFRKVLWCSKIRWLCRWDCLALVGSGTPFWVSDSRSWRSYGRVRPEPEPAAIGRPERRTAPRPPVPESAPKSASISRRKSISAKGSCGFCSNSSSVEGDGPSRPATTVRRRRYSAKTTRSATTISRSPRHDSCDRSRRRCDRRTSRIVFDYQTTASRSERKQYVTREWV